MWELDKYLLNDYWMLASQIHSLQSIPLSSSDLSKKLQAGDIQLSTG